MNARHVSLKLTAAFILLIGILLGIGWLGLSRMELINNRIQEMTNLRWSKIQTVRQALHYSALNSRITMQIFLMDDRQEIEAMLKERAANTAKISEFLKTLEAGADSEAERALVAAVWSSRIPYVENYQQALHLLLNENDATAARKLMANEVTPKLIAYHQSWENFVAFQANQMDQAGSDADKYYKAARGKVLLLLAVALLLASLIALAVTRATVGEIRTRRRAEQHLKEAQEALEHRVELRTSELAMANAEMRKTQNELIDVSRRAGMAEVATNVLHNVGNVLNSVTVASSCLADKLRRSKAANLSKIVHLLRQHEGNLGDYLENDPKGRQLPSYLGQLADYLATEQVAALKELDDLQKNIEHIKDIVNMQQDFAKVAGVTEKLSVADLVDDALRMNSSSLVRHEIQVIREFNKVPQVTVEKHQVLQILVNLIRNAKQACDESDTGAKILTLRVSESNGFVRIDVTDNGIGIQPENLTRLFGHGFTTKKSGHGFGLHSGALAAKELGGILIAKSDGIGKGATFTLELPITPESNSP